MRLSLKNKKTVWVATLVDKQEKLDSDGNSTGEYKTTFDIFEKRVFWYPANSLISQQYFGIVSEADIYMLTNDKEVLKESDFIFLKLPENTVDVLKQYDYKVSSIESSSNYTRYSLKKRI